MSKVSSLVTAAEAQEILNKHNCPRQRYTLKPLVWNWELAAHAQEHADRCIWDHASHIGLGVPGEGENLSLAMNRPVGVDGWLAEERSYNCPNGECAPNAVCGHWTQMAWANTLQIGCGKRRCATLQKAPGFLNSDILVCRYSPPGNYVGQRMVGDSQCEAGASNPNCSGQGNVSISTQPTSTSTTPDTTTASMTTPLPTVVTNPLTTTKNIDAGSTESDKFLAEKQRIAQLQATTSTTAEYVPVVATTRFPVREPLPYTIPVHEDTNEDGYLTADESTQKKSDFTTNIIIAVSVTLVVMIAIVAFISYRYRDTISHVYRRIVTGNIDANVAKKEFLQTFASIK